MNTPAVDVAVPAGAQLGECPLWDPTTGRLYWVDIDGRSIHRFDPVTGRDEVRIVEGRPGSLARTSEAGVLLVAVETGLAWFRWDTGSLTAWRILEPEGSGNRLNDGRTDPAGRFWVGSMFERAAAQRFTGRLHRVDPDGAHTTTRIGIGVTNGLAFDVERRRMYFADTLREAVWRYDYDPTTGVASGERLFADFTDLPGRPDGACVDAEGCYWVAAVYGWAVHRFTPDGRLDRTIRLPVEAPTMPAFGGNRLDVLYVTSIGGGPGRTLAPGQEAAGGMLAVDTGVTGLVDPPFAGRAAPT